MKSSDGFYHGSLDYNETMIGRLGFNAIGNDRGLGIGLLRTF